MANNWYEALGDAVSRTFARKSWKNRCGGARLARMTRPHGRKQNRNRLSEAAPNPWRWSRGATRPNLISTSTTAEVGS
jgi:hypothetical protein